MAVLLLNRLKLILINFLVGQIGEKFYASFLPPKIIWI